MLFDAFDRKILAEPESKLTPITAPPLEKGARPEVCEIYGFAMIDSRVHIYSHLSPLYTSSPHIKRHLGRAFESMYVFKRSYLCEGIIMLSRGAKHGKYLETFCNIIWTR